MTDRDAWAALPPAMGSAQPGLDLFFARLGRAERRVLLLLDYEVTLTRFWGSRSRRGRGIEDFLRGAMTLPGVQVVTVSARRRRGAGFRKRAIVKRLLEEAGEDAAVAFVGDTTDEAVFSELCGRGLSVLVARRRRPSHADIWIRPEELLVFLKRWTGAAARGTLAQAG